jgi:hypothetical protein
MARMRSLRPDYFLREDMADVSLEAHFLLAGLQVLADRDGRLLDRPRTIKAQVFPFREVDIEAALVELVRARAVARYEADGRRIIALLTWEDDQTPHPKETSAGLPPPQPHGRITPSDQPSRKVAEPSRRDPLGLGVGIGSRDGCGSGSLTSAAADAPPGGQGSLDVPPAATPPPLPAKARATRKEPDGEHHALWRALEAEYAQVMGHAYVSGNGGQDAAAVKWLRVDAKATPEEAVRRWGNLLRWGQGGFPAVTGFGSLRQHWNAAEVVGATKGASGHGVAVGRVEALEPWPDAPKSDPQAVEVWSRALEEWGAQGKTYALSWLGRIVPVRFVGNVLSLWVPDTYARDWLEEHYAPMLRATLGCSWAWVLGSEGMAA